MDIMQLIEKYYTPGSLAHHYFVKHGMAVTRKALEIAERLKELTPDTSFIREASMLHDIGIFMTHAPGIGCHGDHPYISHGYLGRELLEKEGLPRHALVCERHVGVGITIEDIEKNGFPFPRRDMVPITLEEKIICFADKFYSKNEATLTTPKPLEEVRQSIARYGEEKLRVFDEWVRLFGEE